MQTCLNIENSIHIQWFHEGQEKYFNVIQCNLDLVTLNLVTICDLVAILQRPFFILLHKSIGFSDIM